MNLYLIRHGFSVANKKKLVTGNIFDVLTETGVQKTERFRVFLQKHDIKADRFITSQWERAKQTAQILWPNVTWEVDSRIGETNAGSVSDWRLDDFLIKYPKFYNSPFNCYPDGESHAQLYKRSIAVFDELIINSGVNDTVLLVTHSGPISCMLQYVTNTSMEKFPAFVPENTSLSVISIAANDFKNAKITKFSEIE